MNTGSAPANVPTPNAAAAPPGAGELGPEAEPVSSSTAKKQNVLAKFFGRDKPPAIQTELEESANQPSPYAFQKSEFLVKESTGRIIDREGKKGPVTEIREVAFSQELANQYKNFLYDHIENLLKVTNPQILDNDAHRHELQLREALTTDNKPDKDKIKEYLESPDGWMITTQLFEDQTAKKLFATGLHAATRPKGERVDQIDENTIRLHLDQGLLNRTILDHIGPFLNERVNVTAGRPEERGLAGQFRDLRRWQSILAQTVGSITMGGATAAMVALLRSGDIPTALAAGGAVAAVIPSLMAIRNTLNSGVTIDLRQCGAALRAIQNDASEMAYLKQVLNIDASNYEVVGPTEIRVRDAHALAPNNIRQIQSEIFQGLYVREQFYTSLGIPNEALDALPEQHLYLYSHGQAEQTGTRWEQRIEEIFQPQTTGIQDTAGRSPNDPDFLTGGATLDFEGNLRRSKVARRQVIVEMMTDHAIKVLDGTKATGAATRIQGKIDTRGEGGTERQKRIKEINDRKTAITKEKDKLIDAKTAIDTYTEARRALETASAELQRDFSAVVMAAPLNQDILTTLENEVNRLNADINQVAIGSIAEARRAAKTEIAAGTTRGINAAVNALRLAYVGIVDPRVQLDDTARRQLQNANIEQETEIGKSMLAEVTLRETEANTQLTNLRRLRGTIKNARDTLTGKADVVIGTARENLADLQVQYAELTGWGLGAAELRNLTVDELMTRINAINVVNGANGWVEAQNNDPASRMRVINAKAEAMAQFEETFDTQKAIRDPQYVRITSWAGAAAAPPVVSEQLRTMSENQLLVLIHNINTVGVGEGWPPGNDAIELPNLRLAMEEAKNRMVLRHNAVITERMKDLDVQVLNQDALIEAISFGDDVDVLTTIKDLMDRQGKIFEMAYDVVTDSTRFTDTTQVVATDPTFSTSEKAIFDGVVPPVGYWRIMNALLDYNQKPDRNSYAIKILKTLPPKALARRINLALGMGLGGVDIENITVALSQLDTLINNGSFTGIDMRSLFRDTINDLRLQADAM